MARNADQKLEGGVLSGRIQQASNFRDGERILSQVDASGLFGYRNVEAVIDQDFRGRSRTKLQRSPG